LPEETTAAAAATTVTTTSTPSQQIATPAKQKPFVQLLKQRWYSMTHRYALALRVILIYVASLVLTEYYLPLSWTMARKLKRNMAMGTVIFAMGDIGAQLWTYRRTVVMATTSSLSNQQQPQTQPWLDQRRFAIAAGLGAVWAGWGNPAVYTAIETLLPGGSSNFRRVLLKMMLSCSILSTAGNYITMWIRRFIAQIWTWKDGDDDDDDDRQQRSHTGTTTTTTFGQHVRQAWQTSTQTCNADFWEVLWDDLKIWPLYDVLCYSVIPPPVRPLTTALLSASWSLYMSLISAREGSTSSSSTTITSPTPVVVESFHKNHKNNDNPVIPQSNQSLLSNEKR
jgi:hypothetical protein